MEENLQIYYGSMGGIKNDNRLKNRFNICSTQKRK